MCKFRDLRADEIECRIQSVKEYPDHPDRSGLVLLLYKDARVDMNILDETVGSANWQREHYECKGNLYCRVGINTNYDKPDLPDRWIWKSDCGTESNTEAVKGESSDSFKRSCFNFGIGRCLYTAPFTWIPADKCNIKNGKCYDKFVVQSITIEDKQIKALEIYNQTKKCVAFTFGKKSTPEKAPEVKEEPKENVITYEKALQLVIMDGIYAGWTLKEVYKKDRDYINSVANDENTPDWLKQAIAVINAEIRKANAK